jgi:hypothetical protein
VNASRQRLVRSAHAPLSTELRLFVLQLRPAWSAERMAAHHERLVAALEREGADVLRRHLQKGFESVIRRDG